mgnify:CR=1 FL=1
MTSSIPNIVSDKKISNINSMSQSTNSISSILAPIIGGLVFAVLNINFFLEINGISFFVSAFLEIFINFNLNIKDKKTIVLQRCSESLKEGFKYLRNNREILILITFACIFNFFLYFGFTMPIPYIINNLFKMPKYLYGLLNSIFPLGMLLYSIYFSVKPQKEIYKGFIRGITVISISYILFGITSSLIIFNFNLYLYFSLFVILFFLWL